MRALARIGDRRAEETLRDQLCFFAWYVPSAKLPLEPNEPDVAWAYWKMRTQGMAQQEIVQELTQTLANDGAPLEAGRMLEMIGQPAVLPLIATLSERPEGNKPEQVQVAAAKVLGRLRAREASEALRSAVRSNESKYVRGLAGRALGQIGDKTAVPDLIAATTTEREDTARFDILGALGELADPRAETVLLQIAAQDANQNIRYVALKALRSAGTAGAIPILEARLSKEPDENVRAEIGVTIRKLSGP